MVPKEWRRRRPVVKSVAFSDDEWADVQRRMALTGAHSFGEFARAALIDQELTVRRYAFDPSDLRTDLSRIGNNVNQIARSVNVDDAASYEQMVATRRLLKQLQETLVRASEGRL